MEFRKWTARSGVVLLGPLAIGVAAIPAQAATAGLVRVTNGSAVEYIAAGGSTNSVSLNRSGTKVVVNDRVPVRIGAGCQAVKGDPSQAVCSASRWAQIVVKTGAGNDVVVNHTAIKLVADGGTGDDKLSGGSGPDELLGGVGSDYLYGGPGNDALNGAVGNDRLYGVGGDDRLDAGDGDDLLSAGAGNDTLLGGTGNDVLVGEDGEDTIDAGAGDDKVTGDGHSYDVAVGWTDTLRGGPGFDTLYWPEVWEQIDVDLNGSAAGSGKNAGDGVAGDFEGAEAGATDSTFTGNAAANVLVSLSSKTVMHGEGGDDTLSTYDGNNTLYGEGGDDTITVKPVLDRPSEGVNLLDGGPNATAAGDKCVTPFPEQDKLVSCER